MENAIVKKQEFSNAMTLTDVKQQVNRIQEIMKNVMTENEHYGKIPGCGNKPTLLKPGAEKILMTFQLGSDFEIEDLSNEKEFKFRIKTKLFDRNSGTILGYGIGDCSTREKKFNHLFTSGISNTVLKMAKKRSLVDAVLTVTAASDIFTQDIEDMPVVSTQQKTNMPTQPKPIYTEKQNKLIGEIFEMCLEMGFKKESIDARILSAGPEEFHKSTLEHYNIFLDKIAAEQQK